MDLHFTPEQQAFRDPVRNFLRSQLPDAIRRKILAGLPRQRALAAAKVVIGQACRFISQQSMQLHGGIGMSDELTLSHWFKRLLAIELAFGGTDAQLQRFIRLEAERAAA